MRGADSWAGTIKSGGKTRRAAKMVVLDVDHPDIREFIWCKAKEEDKAEALRDAGFDMSIDGDGFTSIQYQNANNSVRVTDEFMHAVENDEEWHTTARATGEPVGEPMHARELMREIAEAAWRCADPGVQYDTTINQWHTCPNSGRINASNPCSEYMHVDDSACNLASLNLMKFRRAGRHASTSSAFEHAVDVVLLAQEIVVGPSSYPTEEIGVNARAFRQLGLGYANLGAYLMANGMPYDSDAGRGDGGGDHRADDRPRVPGVGADRRGDRPVRALRGEPRAAQRRHADAPRRVVRDPGRGVPRRRRCSQARAARGTRRSRPASASATATRRRRCSRRRGRSRSSWTATRPASSPTSRWSSSRSSSAAGTMTIVNRTVPLALQTLGYSDEQIEQIEAHINEHGTIVGAPGLADEHLPVFDVAVGERAISHMGHIKMMGAVQPFISGAISKTVNMPQTATVEDIADAYIAGVAAAASRRWRSTATAPRPRRRCAPTRRTTKTRAGGRDGRVRRGRRGRRGQGAGRGAGPARQRMPRERQSITHKFSIGGHEGYITAGMYEDGTVGEIFLTDIGKEGSTLRGMMNSFATAISIALQYGVPLETLVQKFSYMRFEPEGITRTRRSRSPSRCPTTSCAGWPRASWTPTPRRSSGILTPEVRARKMAEDAALSVVSATPPARRRRPRQRRRPRHAPAPRRADRRADRHAAGRARPSCTASTSARPARSAAA